MKLKYLSFLLVVFIAMSCSKYEEGPGFSVLTKKARLCKSWKAVKYIYKNGSSTTNVDKGEIELTKEEKAYWTFYIGNTSVVASGTWHFINDKAGINVNVSAFGINVNENYDIVRLEANDLRVRDKEGTVICFKPA